jgi:hypothetical protein
MTNTRPWFLNVLFVAMMSVAVTGRSALTGDDDDDDYDDLEDDRISSRRDDDNYRTRDRDRYRDRSDDSWYDSSSTYNDTGVPSRARLVKQSDGRDLYFRAPESGTIYLYDVDDRRVVYSGNIRKGERFRLNADDHAARIDDNVVMDRSAYRDHRYRLYFSSNDSRDVNRPSW